MAWSGNNKGVIFDLDGVLVDTGRFHKRAWYDFAEKEGFDFSDELFRKTFGMQNYQIIPMLTEESLSAGEVDSMSQWKEQRYRELIAGRLELLPGVERLVRDLKGAGFRLAVGTSTPRVNLTFMLDNLPLDGCFDALVTSEDVDNGKPAPDTFLKAAEKLSHTPDCCVVIEDAVPGIQAAKAANMRVVAVTTTRPGAELQQADRIVDSLEELTAADLTALLGG